MTMQERIDALIAMVSLRAHGYVASIDGPLVTISSPSLARFEWRGENGWQVQIESRQPESVSSWEEMAQFINRAWPVADDLTGHWVEHKAWGRAVITGHASASGWHPLRYKAVRHPNGSTIWVANAALREEFEVTGPPDDDSASVVALKGPYGEED